MDENQKFPAPQPSTENGQQPEPPHIPSKLQRLGSYRPQRLYGFAFAGIFAVIGASILLLSYAATTPTPKPVQKVILHVATNDAGQQMCLDDAHDLAANGTSVVGFPCNASDPAQQWTLYSNDTIRIHGTQCLDTEAPFNTPGAKIITYVCNDSKSQTQTWSSLTSHLATGTSTNIVDGDSPHLCLTDPQATTSNTQLEVNQCSSASKDEWIAQYYAKTVAIQPGMAALQVMYNNTSGSPSRGLFCTGKPDGGCWWDSANELNTIINYTEQTGDQQYEGDIATTYQYAGKDLGAVSPTPFTDRYNDDDGWWALTWLNAYKLTGNQTYLQTAEGIFAYIQSNGWTSQCGGGVFQFNGGVGANGLPATKDAIANGLYVTLAARLYQATGNSAYLNGTSGAVAAANWFLNSGLIVSSGRSTGLVEDHLVNPTVSTSPSQPLTGAGASTTPAASTTCTSTVSQKSTYNQGMVLGGLTNLYQITGNKKYLDAAKTTANAVLSDNKNTDPALIDSRGVLTEPCTGAPYNCDLNSAQSFLQWKGPFMRTLYCLNAAVPTTAYSSFLTRNANALVGTYRVGETPSPVEGVAASGLQFFGFSWDKYTTAQIGPATQGSALDALNASTGGTDTMCVG